MTERQAAEHLDLEEAEARLAESRAWLVSVLARLEPMLPPKRPLDVLEVGCAQGRSLIALGELGHRAVGIDPEESALTVAGELAARHGIDIHTRVGAAEQIPCESASFDLVVAFSVLEHVDDLQASLREIAAFSVRAGSSGSTPRARCARCSRRSRMCRSSVGIPTR